MNQPGHPAQFSPCKAYRYTLWRQWLMGEGYLMVIGLNPSTADLTKDDPTLRRCIGFAMAWGYAGLCMTNLFAYRATDPEVMKAQTDPVGPENDRWLLEVAKSAGCVLAAWGTHGTHLKRDEAVLTAVNAVQPIHCLTLNNGGGTPKHPLYVIKTMKPKLWKEFK
jgi:hypothetical protein